MSKTPSIQQATLDRLIRGERVTSESFHRAFGGISLTNVMNRLRSRGVPITDDDGTHFITMSDMLDARAKFGGHS